MITRKTFVVRLAAWAGGGTLLSIAGCGGGDDDSDPSSQSPAACVAREITANHGHQLSIPVADLDSTVAMTYSIQGTADHAHQVSFSPAQLAQLKAGVAVTVASTVAFGHSHAVTEACA